MRNEKEEVQYIWHDGVRISEDQLVCMAKRAGSYAFAEHYVCSLLAHGTMYGLPYLIDKVNEIREHYQVVAIPTPKLKPESDCSCNRDIAPKAMQIYRRMPANKRNLLLNDCLEYIRVNKPGMFKLKKQWQGVYMVIRDRLDNGLKMSEFYELAYNATPSMWPVNLRISETVFKNFSRDVGIIDDEAYYEMDYNPHQAFCDAFWEVMKCQVLTMDC